MTAEKFLKHIPGDLSGKTVAISGATGGLGRELCRLLLRSGAGIVMIDRNPEKQKALATLLAAEFPTARIEGIIADMEDLDSVRRAADELNGKKPHVLILNAGAYSIPRHRTELGFDNVFQINFVAPYYLARRLLPCIKANNGRIIAVGSIAHTYSKTDPTDVDFSGRKKASLVYGNAKRYLMYAFFALARQGEPVAVAHPGISFTGITAHYPKLIFALIRHPMKVIFMKPSKACLSIYRAIFHMPPPDHWIGPRIFDVWGSPCIRQVRSASPDEAERIRETAEQIYRDLLARDGQTNV